MTRFAPRRVLGLAIAVGLTVTACGDESSDGPVLDTAGDVASTSDTAASTSDTSADPTTDPADATNDATNDATTDADAAQSGDDTAADARVDAAGREKPEVELPGQVPEDLGVTTLIDGDGPEAAVGDTVVVHYVGVRSEDGTEFDNSYDRGQPFPVTLGTNSVIQGWEQGLLGVRTGDRVQLDIPAALAYGDQPRGDVIRAGDALTFVIDVVEVQKRPEITAPPQADAADCPATDDSEPQQRSFDEMQPFCIDVTKTYTAEIVTNFGDLTVELDPQRAPQTVNNFVTLARYQYFDDTTCHRAIPAFVVQCGDPDASGFGGPGYTIPDELPLPGEYQIGSVVMANTGQPDSGGSQFFIVTGPSGAGLPPQYALFGTVVGGLDSTLPELDALGNPENNGQPPLETIEIESVTITEG